jgi:hypothetical protein
MERDYRRLCRSRGAIALWQTGLGEEISVRIDELRPLAQGESHSSAALVARRKDVPLARQ